MLPGGKRSFCECEISFCELVYPNFSDSCQKTIIISVPNNAYSFVVKFTGKSEWMAVELDEVFRYKTEESPQEFALIVKFSLPVDMVDREGICVKDAAEVAPFLDTFFLGYRVRVR